MQIIKQNSYQSGTESPIYTLATCLKWGDKICQTRMLQTPDRITIDMDETATYLDAIYKACPGFLVEKVRPYNQDGQYNDILILNDEFFFRFPRYGEGINKLKTKVRILTFLQSRLSLPIPNPVYTNIHDPAASRLFMGYRKIPGEPLWREVFQTITDDPILQRLANQLAGFLKELHSIPVESLSEKLPVQDGREEWASMDAEIQQCLFPFLRRDAKTWVSRHFEAYLSTPRLHTYTASLRHGDFGTGNILYDRETQAICGIVDFDSTGIGDPAVDLAAACCFGEDFFRRYMVAYPEIETMLERVQFYTGTFALQEALHGFKNNDRQAFEAGMVRYV